MAKKQDVCDVPGCGRDIDNHLRGLCSRCDGNRHYWRRKKKERGRGAVQTRLKKLAFWSGRLNWLFETRKGE